MITIILDWCLPNLRDSRRALEYYEKALIIQRDLGDKESVARSYNNIALMLQYNLGRYAEAIPYYDKALEINPDDAVTLSSKGAGLG